MKDPGTGPPDELCCSISEDLFEDPVLLVETGQTYDKKSIEQWFAKGHRTCPLTGKELQSVQIVPNYAVRSLVQAWREEHREAGNGSSAAAHSRYPGVYNGTPQHEVEQVDAILKHIRSPSMEVSAYRSGCAYQLWQLSSLAARSAPCVQHMLQAEAPATLASLLKDGKLAEAAAAALQHLATPESAQAVLESGGVDRLIGLLAADVAKTRETAALALHAMCKASSGFCSEAFTAACNAVLHARGDAAVLASMQRLYAGEAPERSAATFLTFDLLLGPGQQWRNYFVCAGTGAVPCLARSLGAEEQGTALPHAASRALVELAALPANSSEVVQELVGALQHSSHGGRQRAALALWQLLCPPGATDGGVSMHTATLMAGHGALVSGLSWALDASCWGAAGLIQALTYDPHKLTNSVSRGPDTDALRMSLIRVEAHLVPLLSRLLDSSASQGHAAAAHAIANLAAYRSGGCAACASRRSQGGLPGLPFAYNQSHQKGAACLHTPQGQLASGTAPCSLIRLACTSPDPVAVAGCVAALNNICTSGEGIERVCEEGAEGVRARMGDLISWKALPINCRDAARALLLRLEGKRHAPPFGFITLLLPAPPPPPAAECAP